MITQIRGTSGSGKTHLVREVMARAGVPSTQFTEPPLKPKKVVSGYVFPTTKIAVVGDYGATCGGCDKFSWKGAADWVENLIALSAAQGYHTVFEGVLVSAWALERYRRLQKVAPFTAIVLTTPIEVCLDSVGQRRLAKGNTEPLDPCTTQGKFGGILTASHKHRDAGLAVDFLDRDAALARTLQLLGLT